MCDFQNKLYLRINRMVTWVETIKKYAEVNGGKFVIPKKGTEDYIKIKEFQEKLNNGEELIKEKPLAKVKPVKVENKSEKVVTVENTGNKLVTKLKPILKVENKEVQVVIEEKLEVKVPKKKVTTIKKENVDEEVLIELQPVEVKVKRTKPKKVENKEIELVVEEKSEVKAPTKTKKQIKEEKDALKNNTTETNAKESAKVALRDARLIYIDRRPVNLDFS